MMNKLPKSISDNLCFLIVEVDSQVSSLQHCLSNPSIAMARRILDRKGYANNLKMRIHSSCINALTEGTKGEGEKLSLRSIEFIATDLEKISELCCICITQLEQIENFKPLQADAYQPLLGYVRDAIALVEPAIQQTDSQQALAIRQLDEQLEHDYKKVLKRYTSALKKPSKQTEALICALFIVQNVRQMGDALLDIAESIISANLGQPLNFSRFHSLRASVAQLEGDEELQVEPIAETRSGCAISGITTSNSDSDHYIAIFKDGEKRKLKEEHQGVKSWHEIYPGLAPKILSYKKRGQSAALLIEHLPGLTFEQILLNEPQLLDEALEQLSKTLRSVWRETRSKKSVQANFMQQLERRIDSVYKIHPEFCQEQTKLCGHTIPAFDELIKQAQEYEKHVKPPFSVYIHGDFNVDNIIYDPVEQRINFIDLHRSRYMDYVQDVSVFMVSNYRLQILDEARRQRIMATAKSFYASSKRHAEKMDDKTFELRLALGLARSFATSTRFILDKSLAKNMFLRARYLIEQVLDTDPKKTHSYQIPLQEIFIA